MATPSYIFIMVGKNDNPIYEAEFSRKKEENRHLNQFIVHSALDMVDECVWGTQNMHRSTPERRPSWRCRSLLPHHGRLGRKAPGLGCSTHTPTNPLGWHRGPLYRLPGAK